MKKNNRFLVTLSISACLAISAMAENAQLEDVTITESAFDTQVKAVTAQQLEEGQASDIKDILSSLPNVIVDGDSRTSQKVYIRGLEDKFSNITIDGAKMDGMMYHHLGDQTIDATLLKVSEIELGANSALSGANVVNGTFKYETKDPSDILKEGEVFGGQISAGFDTARERRKYSAGLYGVVNDQLEVIGMYSSTDDGDIEKGDGSSTDKKHGHLKSILGKVIYKPTDDMSLKFSVNTYDDSGERAAHANIADFDDVGSETMARDTYTLNFDYNPSSELVDLESTVYLNKQYRIRGAEETTGRGSDVVTGSNPEREYINNSNGYDFRNTSIFGSHTLTYGTDYNFQDQEVKTDGLAYTIATDTYTNIATSGAEIKAYGIYLQDEMSFGNFILTPGVRYDYHTLGGVYEETSYSQFSPKFKGKYIATDNLSLRVGYGKIFKGPALGETNFVGNIDEEDVADVEAQTGYNIEGGFDYNLSELLSADDSVIGFTVFKTELNDYGNPSHNATVVSQGDVVTKGYELMFSYNKGGFGLNTSFTLNDVTQTEDGITSETSTSNIPTLKLSTNYQVTQELKLGYGLEYVRDNEYTAYDDRNSVFSTTERDGYHVHGITATYKPRAVKGLSVNFGIDNLLDEEYVRHTSWSTRGTPNLELGRNYKVTLTYKF